MFDDKQKIREKWIIALGIGAIVFIFSGILVAQGWGRTPVIIDGMLFHTDTLVGLPLVILGVLFLGLAALLKWKWKIPITIGSVKEFLVVKSPFSNYDEVFTHFSKAAEFYYSNNDVIPGSPEMQGSIFWKDTPFVDFHGMVIFHTKAVTDETLDDLFERVEIFAKSKQNIITQGLQTKMIYLLCVDEETEAFTQFVADSWKSQYDMSFPVGISFEKGKIHIPWRGYTGGISKELQGRVINMLNYGLIDKDIIKGPERKPKSGYQ
jgi:hypothetical protein